MVYRIGLTGGIGCGKSTVGALLRELGAEYIDADEIVHALLAAGSPVAEQVIAHFGEDVRAADGSVDRRRLGRLVFGDPAALRALEALLHPAVREEIQRRLASTRARVVVIDAIKLIESGLAREVDSVWVVVCDPAVQRQRLVEQRGLTPAEVEQRVAAQAPQAERLAHADIVIDNSGSLAATREQVLAAWRRTVEAAAVS